MSKQLYYPPLDAPTVKMLATVFLQMSINTPESYLKDSPYPKETQTILLDLQKDLKAGATQKMNVLLDTDELGTMDDQVSTSALSGADMEVELSRLFRKLKQYGTTLTSDDSAEKASYFRVATSLMTKLVDLREKVVQMNRFSTFRTRVMAILGSVLTVDQRNIFLKQLEEEFGETTSRVVTTSENAPSNGIFDE